METDQLLKIGNEEVDHLPVEQLPEAISAVVVDISNLSTKITDAIGKATQCKSLADEASMKKAGWSLGGKDKKEAIEALQKVVVEQSETLSEFAEANNELFQHQQKMLECLTYLFSLGVANTTANRIVVRALELKLQNASEEELNELARQELKKVVLSLREQEDIQKKIEDHGEILLEQRNAIGLIQKALGEQETKIKKLQMELVGKSFLDTSFYKILMGVIAVSALICSLVF